MKESVGPVSARWRRATPPVLLALLLSACGRKEPPPASGLQKQPAELTRAASIGSRREPLSDAEADALRAAGITRLYWHSADIVRAGNVWQFPQTNPVFAPALPDDFERVPVLRLAAAPDTASTRGSFPALGDFIAAYLRDDPSATLQIDYDCPDDLLPRYAELLGYVRAAANPERLSITAHAGWADQAGFDLLQQQADEIAVHLFDLRSDPPSDIAAGKAIPLVDLVALRGTLPLWRARCRKPWFAGLPNVSRLTVFNNTGLLSSQVREWDPNALAFHPELEIIRQSPSDGITWLVPRLSATITASLTVDPAQQLLLRQPADEALRESARLAAEAGATGIVWSSLPLPDAGTGFTASHLTSLLGGNKASPPMLTVTYSAANGVLSLANEGPRDLPLRVAGAADGGWQLEIDGGDEEAFTAASPGAFARLLGHTAPDSPEPVAAPVAGAQRITFSFASLPAGTSLDSGPVLRRPGAKLRWRLDRGEWRAIEPAP